MANFYHVWYLKLTLLLLYEVWAQKGTVFKDLSCWYLKLTLLQFYEVWAQKGTVFKILGPLWKILSGSVALIFRIMIFSVYYDYICFAGGKRVKFKFYDATGKRVKLEVVLTQFKGIV